MWLGGGALGALTGWPRVPGSGYMPLVRWVKRTNVSVKFRGVAMVSKM